MDFVIKKGQEIKKIGKDWMKQSLISESKY